ncbi:MAG: hypothetical protein ACK5Z5_05455 [Neisseriaceae bacterium]
MGELTLEQINKLVKNFYTRIKNDELLGPIFNDIAEINWDEHIDLLTQFCLLPDIF